MDTQNWLDQVKQQLIESGISVAYRVRLMDELYDHVEDLCREERNHAMSAEAAKQDYLDTRLGKPLEVAQAAKEHSPRAKFAFRHPVVTFLVLPIPMLLILWIGYTLSLVGIVNVFKSYKDTNWAVTAATVLIHGLAYVPAIALTLIIAWVALRSQIKTRWGLAASALVAFVSGLLMVTFHVPTTPGTGVLSVGLGFPPDLSRWPQIIVPLAVALACALYISHKHRVASLTSPL